MNSLMAVVLVAVMAVGGDAVGCYNCSSTDPMTVCVTNPCVAAGACVMETYKYSVDNNETWANGMKYYCSSKAPMQTYQVCKTSNETGTSVVTCTCADGDNCFVNNAQYFLPEVQGLVMIADIEEQLADGVYTLPDGYTLPPGYQLPAGYSLPAGFTMPPGYELPAGYSIPSGYQLPSGYANILDSAQKAADNGASGAFVLSTALFAMSAALVLKM